MAPMSLYEYRFMDAVVQTLSFYLIVATHSATLLSIYDICMCVCTHKIYFWKFYLLFFQCIYQYSNLLFDLLLHTKSSGIPGLPRLCRNRLNTAPSWEISQLQRFHCKNSVHGNSMRDIKSKLWVFDSMPFLDIGCYLYSYIAAISYEYAVIHT